VPQRRITAIPVVREEHAAQSGQAG